MILITKFASIIKMSANPVFSLISKSLIKSVNMYKWYETIRIQNSLNISFFVVKWFSNGLTSDK